MHQGDASRNMMLPDCLKVASCLSIPQFSSHFDHLDRLFLERMLQVFPCLDLVKFGVYGKLTLPFFQQD